MSCWERGKDVIWVGLSPEAATNLTQGQSASSPAQYVTRDENDENKEQRDGMSQHDFHNIRIIRVSMEVTSKMEAQPVFKENLRTRPEVFEGRLF